MLKVLTFNMWGKFGPWRLRWQEAARRLPELEADVMCLQEATDRAALEKVAQNTGTRIAVSDLSTGLAILTRLEIGRTSVSPYRNRSPVEKYIRKYVSAEIGRGSGAFCAVNTHLSWKKTDDATRISQGKELLVFLEKLKRDVLLCGDFNAEYGSETIRPLREAGYRDLLSGTPYRDRPTWDNANPFIRGHRAKFPNRRIDLMMAREGFLSRHSLRRISIVWQRPSHNGMHLSDHYGVFAAFD